MTPSSLKTVLSWLSASRFVSGRMPWSVTYVSPFDLHRDHLALEAALFGRLVGELVRAHGELVELASAGSRTPRRSSRRPGPGRRSWCFSISSGVKAKPKSSWVFMPAANGSLPMCSTPPPMTTSWTPEATCEAARLTACWAEPHCRSIVVADVSIGKPVLQPGVAADVQALRAELHDAAGDHVLDLAGVDAGALDHRAVGGAQQLVRVGVLVVALLEVAAPDRACGRPRRSQPRVRPGGHCHSSPFQVPPAAVFGGGRGHMLRAPMEERIGIVGSGAIATGIAKAAADHGDVVLWARSDESADRVRNRVRRRRS